jgi:hypothetical protein
VLKSFLPTALRLQKSKEQVPRWGFLLFAIVPTSTLTKSNNLHGYYNDAGRARAISFLGESTFSEKRLWDAVSRWKLAPSADVRNISLEGFSSAKEKGREITFMKPPPKSLSCNVKLSSAKKTLLLPYQRFVLLSNFVQSFCPFLK